MIFPVETMYKHVKDKEALKCLKTPYRFIGDDPYLPECGLTPLLKEAGAIITVEYDSDGCPWWFGLQHCVMKEIEWMSEEEIKQMEEYGVTPPMPPMYQIL